ncbi:MAG: hypothetical protein ACM3SO_13165 [Betaproteobacteria bacterium]
MRLARAASAPWLLAHEMRLLWRSFGIRSRIVAGLAVIFVAFAHAAGWMLLRSHALEALIARAPGSAIAITVFVVLFVVSSAFGLAVRVLLERGDLELLLASPVRMRTVYGVRALTVALASVGSIALFALPLGNMGPFVGQWRALAAWPALGALGLAAAALALAGTLGLVRWLGLRRARVVAQLMGAFVGVAFVLALQAEALLPSERREALHAWVQGSLHDGWLGPDSLLLWPLRAFMGEALPLAAVVAIATALFAGVIRATEQAFLHAVQDAPAADAPRRGARGLRERSFGAGLVRLVVAKELTLVARDPTLMSKALLQMLFLLPLFIVLARRTQPAEIMASALVVIAAGIAGTFAWMTVSGEEAADLLASAPVPLERVRRLKAFAALVPVAIVMAPFVAWYAWLSPAMALVVVLFIALALASSAVVQVWSTPMGGGRDLRQRYRQNPFVNIADTVSSFGWGFACYLALAGSGWLAAGIAIGCIAPAAAWLSGRRARA